MEPVSILSWDDKKRARMAAAAVVVAMAAVPAANILRATTLAAGSALTSVIVRETPGGAPAAAAAVAATGGHITKRIDVIHGSAAEVPRSLLPWLSHQPGVAAVTPDIQVLLAASSSSATGTTTTLYSTLHDVGVDAAWTAGYTGNTVGVALVDSGVAPVQGLIAPGKVVDGPDFSSDGETPSLRYLDAFGHGTHMAGIISGRDSMTPGRYVGDTSDFLGVAPDSHIVNVKVANANGSTDLIRVLLGIDWVVRHHADPALNIRVLSLSFSANTSQPYTLDPLAFAVEAAWHSGIVVTAAVGNQGAAATGLSDPAFDPFVIAVAASADKPTTHGAAFSTTPFSSVGNATRSPDLAAPGKSLLSLRVPGSYIDQHYGATARVGTRFFLGSGTSQATALAAGVAALLVQEHPTATPDQIKSLMTSSTAPVSGGSLLKTGAGELMAGAAVASPLKPARQAFPPATGGGPVAGPSGAWTGGSWSSGWWSGGSWSGGSWSGGSWSGGSWSGGSWSGSSWSASSWS